MSIEPKRCAVFFDRDGTLNHDIHYLYRPEDFVWTDGAREAIKYLNDLGYLVIVITNQSGVARGFYSEDDVKKLHAWMNEELKSYGAHIDDFYYCPYYAGAKIKAYDIDSPDRKPAPGMLLRAMKEHGIAPENSFMIGDMPSDLECARRAGVQGLKYNTDLGHSLFDFVKEALKKFSK